MASTPNVTPKIPRTAVSKKQHITINMHPILIPIAESDVFVLTIYSTNVSSIRIPPSLFH